MIVTKKLVNPWTPHDWITAHKCWACHRSFTEKDVVKVIDSVDPKIVHDVEPCASAMIQQVQGQ